MAILVTLALVIIGTFAVCVWYAANYRYWDVEDLTPEELEERRPKPDPESFFYTPECFDSTDELYPLCFGSDDDDIFFDQCRLCELWAGQEDQDDEAD